MVDKVEDAYVISLTTGKIVATGVSWEEYMERYAEDFCEWVEGTVVKMSPIHERHDLLTRYLAMLFGAYFDLRPIGQIRQAAFVMRLPSIGRSREPDIQIILENNPYTLTPTYMDGPADICIEVVSPESIQRDHGAKYEEYEKGGVPEYWIFDPLHRETRFYRLGDDKTYSLCVVDEAGDYTTPLLPGFVLHVPTLWIDPLPGIYQIVDSIRTMLDA
jgi:Uma2 family endonuclease